LPSADSKLYFVTRNEGKFREAQITLKGFGIDIEMIREKSFEIQSDDLEEIALQAALRASFELGVELIVEDAGLFIEALQGFPGPYSSYVYRTIGLDGVLTLMQERSSRLATFKSVVAYSQKGSSPSCFRGTAQGFIAESKKGSGGFGFDPIFVPAEGDGRAFSEMDVDEKNALSHRGRALRNFAAWYMSRSQAVT